MWWMKEISQLHSVENSSVKYFLKWNFWYSQQLEIVDKVDTLIKKIILPNDLHTKICTNSNFATEIA